MFIKLGRVALNGNRLKRIIGTHGHRKKNQILGAVLMFSMSMGTDYSFEPIFIETHAPQFIGHNKFFLGSVFSFYFQLKTCTL